ncbi:MAG: 16S rRNA (cytosine(1402)-N(4))-methyltransferase RsmH [Oscillospiraceae bacterium]|jgi:16S rRNA (cytosine1402-N4)-methyltransferase|nr:16S rRNA (cytosine(1402)-N(4))-methyltransferase RsmH [Oscillospiraceae bacterium]
MEFKHIPVLLDACIEGLAIKPGGVYVDGTAGGAGHSEAIAKKLTTGRLVAIDKDGAAIETARARLAPYERAVVVQSDFRDMPAVLDKLDIPLVDGILLDLGVSSHQLDNPVRGFSYHHDAPLDMRMSGEGLSAYDVVNAYSVEQMTRVLRDYGEEKFARRIAVRIDKARQEAPIKTTFELVDAIKAGIPAAARREGGHPAKRSFQAIRIEVNGELESLGLCLDTMFERLSIGGRFAVITFHSLEDRMVKQRFAGYCTGCTCPPDFPVCVCGKTPRARLVNRKPVTAGPDELALNNRSHSAKLRVLEKIK